MAFVHGSNSTMVVDGTTVSSYVDNVSFSRDVDLAEVTAFGNDDKAYIAGLEGATLSITGHWDATADAALHGTFDAASFAWSYSPDAGTTTYSGNAFVTNYTQNSPVGDRVNWSLSATITGAVSRA